MSQDSFSFSMPPGSGAATTDDRTRYLAPPFDARVADSGQALLLIHGDSQVRRLPVQLVQVFGQCNRFRTLDEHERAIAQALRVPPPQTGAIRQALEELTRRNLLQTEAAVLTRLKSPAVEAAGRESQAISCLFVRTCGRPETLDRLLSSLRRRARPDGLEQVIVLDDDAEAQGRQAARSVVDRHRDGFPAELTLIDRADRGSILDRIAKGAGADPSRLRWCIEGAPESAEPSYGASLNFALMLGAGRLITLVDDDASIDAFELPDCSPRPAIRRRQSARLHFPEPGAELPGGAYTGVDAHPVSLHAQFLGAGPARLVAMSEGDTSGLLDDVDPQLLSELSGASRIRLTSSGTLGDPGTRSLQWLFHEQPEHLGPLCESEARYRALVEQRRVARSSGRPEVTTAFALMTTTMTGVDNRELLAPTQPRGSNEDQLFGALVGFLHPDTCHANLPHMLLHRRPDPRRWQASDLDEPRGVNRGGFLTARVHTLRSSLPGGDVNSRAELLADAFDALARTHPDELGWQLRQELLEVRSQFIERVAAVREALEPPPWLDRDFERVLARHGRVDGSDQQRLDEIARNLPAFLADYSAALPDWAASWYYCRSAGIDNVLEDRA